MNKKSLIYRIAEILTKDRSYCSPIEIGMCAGKTTMLKAFEWSYDTLEELVKDKKLERVAEPLSYRIETVTIKGE